MIRKFSTVVFCLSIFLAGALFVKAESTKDVLGIYVGMNREEAIKVLQQIGKKDHDERKQQEIWKLRDDKRFSHVIVAFDKEREKVRFVTAKAREDGHIRYSDVIDIKKAAAQELSNNYKYVLTVPKRGGKAGFKIIARGTDKNYLTYFAVEELDGSEKEID